MNKDKYKQLINFYGLNDLSDQYEDANYFEKLVLSMRINGWTYGQIQKILGNPSKKLIRQTLLKFDPNLIDNSTSKIKIHNSKYSELYNILIHTDKTIWNIFGDDTELCIKDHQIYYDDSLLNNWSEVEQSQVLEEVKKQL